MTASTLEAELRFAAARAGAHTALVADDHRMSYAELDRAVDGFAGGLAALGVQRGDRVAVIMRNSVEAAVSVYGIVRAGAAFTLLNPGAPLEKLQRLLAHCDAVAAVADAPTAAALRDAGAARHVIAVGGPSAGMLHFDALVASQPRPLPPVHSVDLASIIYTSGSTGEPKGAVFLHRNMTFVAGSICEYLELTADERILCVLPLSHTYGLYHLIMSVRLGATLVLQHGIALPGRVVEALERERITMLPGIPTVWQVLVSLNGLADRPLPHLRVLTNAGAALPASRLEAVRRTFPRARLYSMYGQTECKRVCYLPPEQLDSRPGSVGIAIPGTEVWVEGEPGRAAAPGEVGELMIRGDHVMQGYWNDPGATARKLVPGRWPGDRVLRSGDLFQSDSEGFLTFVARSDDIIKSRGEKVAPRAVEDVLHDAPGVREAAVVGVEDELLGQAVVAHVSALDGHVLEPLELRRHCAEHLESYMVPARVIVHDELPKSDNGKLDRLSLARAEGPLDAARS
jgi:long-chain acyl-CoA synthetase